MFVSGYDDCPTSLASTVDVDVIVAVDVKTARIFPSVAVRITAATFAANPGAHTEGATPSRRKEAANCTG